MSETETEDWRDRATELCEHGVPGQRANVVALREREHSYSEIASELGFGADNDDRSQVKYHLDAYRGQRADSEWLIENGPEL
jgi:hypothetical protein